MIIILLFVILIRLKRDITERERDLVGVLQQYNTFVKPVSICLSIVRIYFVDLGKLTSKHLFSKVDVFTSVFCVV